MAGTPVFVNEWKRVIKVEKLLCLSRWKISRVQIGGRKTFLEGESWAGVRVGMGTEEPCKSCKRVWT
jgi:hypothetical protein